jgi:hypothetical protein
MKFEFLKGFRTLLVNLVMTFPLIVDVVLAVLVDPQFGSVIPPEWYPLYTLAVITVNAYMRTITNTPVGKAEEVPK